MRLNEQAQSLVGIARHSLPVVAVVVLAVALMGLLYVGAELFLLLFAGLLLALLLRALARPLERAKIPPGLAFAAAVFILFSVVGGVLLLFGPLLIDGFAQLADSLPEAADVVMEKLQNHPAVVRSLQHALGGQGAGIASGTLARVAGIFSTVIGGAIALVVVVFTAVYVAAEPDLYRTGLLRLVPPRSRPQAGLLLDELTYMLTWWLFGQFVSMFTIGVLTWVGLMLLGVPLATTLALAAALLTFIPTIGPVLAAIPAVLVGFTETPLLAVYVVLLYIAVESLESYLVTPLVQRQVVNLPPVLVLAAQLLLAVQYGLLGLFVAAPLSVLFMVLVKRIYVEGVLGDTEQT
ncbi:MAG: AI-2E family transporter [Gammaproteobacteria bacterium]|nr:AI-2E family transporter [Gammaproteobacteria bacterium]